MSDYVVKISESGHSYTEGDAHLIYSSQYPTLKILANGSWSVFDSTGSGETTEIYHNLGYKPMYFVYGQWWDGNEVTEHYVEYPFSYYMGLQVFNSTIAIVDETKLTIGVGHSLSGPSSQTYTGFYIIFYEPSV